ncbi:MAG: heparinase II/III family protein [Rhizobiales bacterium]|nr:heparinase II/III family protein [Hyphomicrobiales bacterium]
MTGRSTAFGDEGTGVFRRLGNLAMELGTSLTGGGSTSFTGVAPALPALMAGNPAIAQQLYRGIYRFAGHTVECQPTQIFEAAAPTAAWSDGLHGFAWLSHLEAPGLALYRAFARSLVQNWAAQRRRTSFDASCRRLMSLSRHAGFVLSGASAQFESRFLYLVTREAVQIARLRPRGTAQQLRQSIAVLTAALAFRGGGSLGNDALARTASLIASVILPDGGPADRSPKSLLDLLADLVPLRAAMEAQRIAIPQGLNAAMERAIPMLRMLCHGDEGLAVFHGVEHTSAAIVRAIFEHDVVQGSPLSHAAQSGYCRMSQGQSIVIADCGAPAICDSALAFEFSDGPQRIVGSCGVPANASPAWQAAARTPAAHSTLRLDNESIKNSKPVFSRKTTREPASPVTAELFDLPQGTLVKARSAVHSASGLIHHREIFLASGGHDLRGEDSIERSGADRPANFIIRFHLHPAIKASANRKGAAIILLLPNKEAWQFSARGGAMMLEESIYLASGAGPRHSWQIVVRGAAQASARINWAFRKLERQARHNGATGAAPQLPF